MENEYPHVPDTEFDVLVPTVEPKSECEVEVTPLGPDKVPIVEPKPTEPNEEEEPGVPVDPTVEPKAKPAEEEDPVVPESEIDPTPTPTPPTPSPTIDYPPTDPLGPISAHLERFNLPRNQTNPSFNTHSDDYISSHDQPHLLPHRSSTKTFRIEMLLGCPLSNFSTILFLSILSLPLQTIVTSLSNYKGTTQITFQADAINARRLKNRYTTEQKYISNGDVGFLKLKSCEPIRVDEKQVRKSKQRNQRNSTPTLPGEKQNLPRVKSESQKLAISALQATIAQNSTEPREILDIISLLGDNRLSYLQRLFGRSKKEERRRARKKEKEKEREKRKEKKRGFWSEEKGGDSDEEKHASSSSESEECPESNCSCRTISANETLKALKQINRKEIFHSSFDRDEAVLTIDFLCRASDHLDATREINLSLDAEIFVDSIILEDENGNGNDDHKYFGWKLLTRKLLSAQVELVNFSEFLSVVCFYYFDLVSEVTRLKIEIDNENENEENSENDFDDFED